MEFGRAFTFAFDDPDWLKKVGLAALVLLIPIVGGIIVLGWGLEITRRVINNDPQPLPAWDNFGEFLSKGFQAAVVSFAYVLPAILIYACGYGLTFGLIFATNGNADSNTASGIATILSVCMSCVVFILALAAGLIIPAAHGNLAATGELGSAFRFNEVIGMLRAAPGPYVLVLLGVGLANLILSPLGMLICGIGLLVSIAYTSVVSGHLTGQAYKAAKAAQATSF